MALSFAFSSEKPRRLQGRGYQRLGFRAGYQHRRGHLNIQGPELPVAGKISYRFAFPAPDHERLEAGQFFGVEGLVVAEIEVQAAEAQGVGQENFGRGPGFRDPFGAEIVGGPPEGCQDGPGCRRDGHLYQIRFQIKPIK